MKAWLQQPAVLTDTEIDAGVDITASIRTSKSEIRRMSSEMDALLKDIAPQVTATIDLQDSLVDSSRRRSAPGNPLPSDPNYKVVLLEAVKAKWAANAAKQRALSEGNEPCL
jgi:hypothetical protein